MLQVRQWQAALACEDTSIGVRRGRIIGHYSCVFVPYGLPQRTINEVSKKQKGSNAVHTSFRVGVPLVKEFGRPGLVHA